MNLALLDEQYAGHSSKRVSKASVHSAEQACFGSYLGQYCTFCAARCVATPGKPTPVKQHQALESASEQTTPGD